MLTNLKFYFSRLLTVIGGISASGTSLWLSYWQNNQPAQSFFKTIFDNIYKLNLPPFWLSASIMLIIYAACRDIKRVATEKTIACIEEDYRKEKNDHHDTTINYKNAIEHIIRLMFKLLGTEYHKNFRVSIYRHDGNDSLRLIHRHAYQTQFETSGRITIPDNEGVVGAAWQGGEAIHASMSGRHNSKKFKEDLESRITPHGAKPPSTETTMKSRVYFATAIHKGDTQETKMAVIVLESTDQVKLDVDKLETMIKNENNHLATYIKHIDRIDSILNPREVGE